MTWLTVQHQPSPNGNRLRTSLKHNTSSGEDRQWVHCYLQCWRQLLASSSHHTVQSHWVLRDINIHSSHSQQPRVFVLGASGNAWIQSLWFTDSHLHHSPARTIATTEGTEHQQHMTMPFWHFPGHEICLSIFQHIQAFHLMNLPCLGKW